MREEGHISTFTTAYSAVAITLIGLLYVDDTDLIIVGEKNETETTVHQRLQNAITVWNGALNVTCGALRPEKCYWYFMNFTWKNGTANLSSFPPQPILLHRPNTLQPKYNT